MKKMIDSGIEWIGEVPESWSILRFKDVVTIHNGRDYKEIELEEGGFPVYGSGGVFSRASEYIWNKPSVLLGRKGTIDKPLYVDTPFWTVDTMFYTSQKRSSDMKYLYYYSTSFRYDYYATSTALPSMTQYDLGSIKLAVPILEEQKAIADFLDEKCSQIDSIIFRIEKQIELLKEYKKSLITETVTKGLDNNVRIKDSGVEWIGKIPEDWKISKVKFFCSQIGSGTTPNSSDYTYYDGEFNWIQSGDLYNTSAIKETAKTITKKAIIENSSLRLYKQPFLIIAMYGASIGNVAMSYIDAYTNQACCVLKGNHSLMTKYLFYYMESMKQELINLSVGGGQPNISQEIIKRFYVIEPTFDSQTQIVDFLDKKCTQIDAIVNKKEKQLELLEEHRKSLIYEYVTGKKRVEGYHGD